jgi:tetratricopeptide (TPR) repeat protein
VAVSTVPPAQPKPEHDKALELVKKASPGEQKYLEAAALNRAQKPAEALAAFEALRAEYPEERMIQMMVGQLSIGQGKLDQARAALEKAIAMDGSTARAYAILGNVLILQGDYAKARESLQNALAKRAAGIAPGGVYFPLALSYLYEANPDSALTTLRSFLDEYKKAGQDAQFPEVFIWNSMARINLENGRLEEAMRCYQKGYEAVPGSSLSEKDKKVWLGRLHHGTARTLARMGKPKEAWAEAETIKKMIDEGGEDGKQYVPAYHYLAGYLKLEAGDYPAAIEHLKQADKDDPFHQLLLARAYEKAGDKENAKKVYGEVAAFRVNNLERALSYPEARKKLTRL